MFEYIVEKIAGMSTFGKPVNIVMLAVLPGIAPILGGAFQVFEKAAKGIAVGLINIGNTPGNQ